MRLSIFIGTRILILLLGLSGGLLYSESGPRRGDFLFVHRGRVLAADPATLRLEEVGSLSPAAPTVTADDQGLLWGRLDPNYLAAWSPEENRIVALVPLRHKVYHHVLADNGKAYVTHNALTAEGFSVSVVDIAQRKLVGEIRGIRGLRTDLLDFGGFVYLATLGVRQEDYLHLYLYRIDTSDDRLAEIRRYPRADYYWLTAASSQSLFICYLATSEGGPGEMIEVMDLKTLEIRRRIDASFWGADRRLVQLVQAPGRALLLCRDAAGNGILIESDPELTIVRRDFALSGPVDRILGAEGTLVMYFDSPLGASPQGVALCFYDFGAGREVKRFDLAQVAEARRE